MLEALSTSDFHLDGMNKHFTDANTRQLLEIDKIYQYALKNGIKHVFIPGDISDKPVLSNEAWVGLMALLFKYDGLVHTYYVNGNHDKSDVDTTACDFLQSLQLHGALKTFRIFLQAEQVKIDGVNVNFIPWPHPETLTEKKGSLNLAHVTYNGAIGDTGRVLRVKKDEFKSHKNDFTITGHIHQYQYLRERKALYHGNPFQKNFGESLPKGFVHFKAKYEKNELIVRHRFVDNSPNFQLINLLIESPKDFRKLSTSDSYRYKLMVSSDVIVPPDLRLQFPNITGGVFNATTKKLDSNVEESALEGSVPKSITSPTKKLKGFLKRQGFKSKDIKVMYALAKEARSSIGA